MKYGLIFLIGITASLLIPLPARGQSDEHSQETGVIHDLLKNDQKQWEQILTEQLARREEQLAIEKARQTEIEATEQAQKQNSIKPPQQTKKPLRIEIKHVVSTVNSYSRGYCTWYVANQRPIPSGWGNARNWLANARSSGWATGSTPQIGAIAWTGAGSMGHVGLVTGVNGSQITITEMNYAGFGVVSSRVANASSFSYIY